MSGTEGSLRKSKRQHVPNPIYSAGINELKMVKFFIIFRRHTPKQRKKEKGKILNLKKISQVYKSQTTLGQKVTIDGYIVWWRVEKKWNCKSFLQLDKPTKKGEKKLNSQKRNPQIYWAFFKKLLKMFRKVKMGKAKTSNKWFQGKLANLPFYSLIKFESKKLRPMEK